MKKLFFSLLIAFTVIFAGCKQNFLQTEKDENIQGYAKVSVNYEESDRAVYPDVDEFKKSLGSAKYTLLCDDKVVELDSNKSVLIPYGTHAFTLYLSNNTGSIFYEGKKSQEEINQSTTTLTFSLSDSVVKGALDYYFALIKNEVTQRIDSWYSYILKTELLNINDISSKPIEVTVNELPMIVYNEALESSCAYYLYNLVTYDVEPGTYLLTIKGDVYECNGNNPEPDLNNPSAKDYPFYTDKVVITKGLTSSNKNDIVYCNLTANPNMYPITYANSEDIANLDDLPKYYFYGEKLQIPSAESNNDNNNNKTFVGWFEDKDFTKHFLNNGKDFYNRIGNVTLYPKFMKKGQYVLYNFNHTDFYLNKGNKFEIEGVKLYVAPTDFHLNLTLKEGQTSFDGIYALYQNYYDYYIKKYFLDETGYNCDNSQIVKINNEDYNSITHFYIDNLSDTKTVLFSKVNNIYFVALDETLSGKQEIDLTDEKNIALSSEELEDLIPADYKDYKNFYVDVMASYGSDVFFVYRGSYYDSIQEKEIYCNLLYKYNVKKDSVIQKEIDDTNSIVKDMIVVMGDKGPSLYALVNRQYGYYASNTGYIAEINMDTLGFEKYGLSTNSEPIEGADLAKGYFSLNIVRPESTTSNEFFGPDKFIAIEPKKLFISDSGYFYWDIVDCNKGKAIDINRIVEYDLENKTIDVFDTDANFTDNNCDGSFLNNVAELFYTHDGTYYTTISYNFDK